jgi:hypothetical protein
MKAILLIITLAASTSCAMPTAVGTDFATGQYHLGGRAAVVSSSGSDVTGSGGEVFGDSYTIEFGTFFTDQLEIGATTEHWELFDEDFDEDLAANFITGYARYYTESEGNVRPFVIIGAGSGRLSFLDHSASGNIYRVGAGITQFISDTASIDISAEQQFASFLSDDFSEKIEVDTVNGYFGVNFFF